MSFIMIFSRGCGIKQENEIVPPVARTTSLNIVSYSSTGSGQQFNDKEMLTKLSKLSNKIYEMSSEEENGNYALSPLSIYMALVVLHYIGDEYVKNDIETLFEMKAEDLAKTGELFLSLIKERKFDNEIYSKLDLTNSIWIDNNINGNKNVLDGLAEELFCYAYNTSFNDDITQANEDTRKFIKEKTNGLIDKDFDLQSDTLFAIINTLYFKDIWNGNGYKLKKENRKFYIDEQEEQKVFLISNYENGQVAETTNSKFFYAATESGYKIKFILPKEGYTLKQVMSAENLNIINEQTLFDDEDDEFIYRTRCIFPKFNISSETNLKEILEENGYLLHAFNGYTSDLVDVGLSVSDIIHNVELDVDDEGIEGAAVTIIVNKATSTNPNKYVYQDFVVDRGFGFIVTDYNNTILFEGQVVNP